MGRAPRIYVPEGLFHVTINSVDDEPAFCDRVDCAAWLSLLKGATKRFRVVCHGYCLMGTHEHVLVRTLDDELAEFMQWLNGNYARRFNQRHRRRGHLFRARYDAKNVETQEHLLESIRYLAMNPVRAGACERPEDWRWGSYRSLICLEDPLRFVDVAWVRRRFSRDPARAIDRIRRFVDGARARPRLAA